jgi:hypothetical protein
VQSFGQRVAHIADATLRACSVIKGEQKSLGAASKTAKADHVAALKASYNYCDAVFESLTPDDANRIVTAIGCPNSSRSGIWSRITRRFTEPLGFICASRD